MKKLISVPKRFETEALWQKFWREQGKEAAKIPNLRIPLSKKLFVYADELCDREVISHIMHGMMLLCVQTKLSMQINRESDSKNLNSAILKSTDENGKINCDSLVPNLDYDKGLIIITSKQHTNPDIWGEGDFYSNVAIISLTPGQLSQMIIKDELSSLQKIAKHIVTHLLGYSIHHDDTTVPIVREIKNCNMFKEIPSLDTCPKCIRALVSFWEGLREK